MTRTLAAIGPIALILSACTPAADRGNNSMAAQPEANAADEMTPGNDVAANTTGNEAAPARSILRPEIVAPEPEPPALEPLDRVIPFPQPGRQLDDEGRTLLDSLLTDPIMRAGGAITLSGHSDSKGNDSANLRVSRQRAEAVRDYLVEKGVAPTRITVIALGETRPLAPNAHPDGSDDPEARARNRRVEIAIALPQAPDTVAPAGATDGNQAAATPTQ